MSSHESDPAVAAAEDLRPARTDRVGVAASGGPDSLAALALVARACAARGVPVFALHVAHGLREGAADRERGLVRDAARSVGADFAFRAVDVAGARSRSGGSVEFVARALRYDALAAMASELRLTHVVLAHHQDDQIETILLAVLRGAWPGALAGMPRERELGAGSGVRLVRPFLGVPRSALRPHAQSLHPVSDPMNEDPAYRRVAVRERLLPALRASDPEVDRTILGIGLAARRLDALAEAGAARILDSEAVYAEPGAVTIQAGALRPAGRFALARLLKACCERDPALGHATWALVRRCEEAAASDGPWEMRTRRGVVLTARWGVVALFTRVAAPPSPVLVRWDGAAVEVPVDPVRVLRIAPLAPGDAPPAGALPCRLEPGARIEVRPRRPGDRFRLGPQGSKAVADELCDRKVQPVWRTRVPVVLVDGVVRWLPGLRTIRAAPGPPPNAFLALRGPVPWADQRYATT